MRASALPRSSLDAIKVNGGMTSSKTLLTTYMPPQIAAAARPLSMPSGGLAHR